MAKTIIEVDTEKRTIAVSIDGKKISNVSDVYVSAPSKDYDYFSMQIGTMEEGEDIKKRTNYFASSSEKWEVKASENPKEETVHRDLAQVLLQRKID